MGRLEDCPVSLAAPDIFDAARMSAGLALSPCHLLHFLFLVSPPQDNTPRPQRMASVTRISLLS